ncbi:diuretic hormone receptor-like [Lingula anatina]|uniref:Diuretic hormone receptor-like n=1 Tax=Lingula anatina TaxID=7574 RepID=A0A1S3IQW1_LINAN|nr:diuretic hormone receptor-like [Lingula anatina]|eukprot:XP_013400605.1 diuretic hormone receptor-like [Lingula anatina]
MLKLASETNGTESGMEDAWLTLSVEGEPKGLEEDALEQSTFNEDLWHNLLDQLSKAEMCRINFEVEPYPPTDHGQVYCNRSWNGATCWPTTLAGHWATAFCPPEVEGVSLDVTQNATRYCHPNGMWNEKSNYDNCTLLSHVGIENLEEFEMVNLAARMIYFVGFSISSLALISALLIFSYFRSLHCLRNTIHSHLMGSFLLRILVWVMLHFVTRAVFLEPDIKDVSSGLNWFCKILTALSHYSTIANFFWMLMEGLYLHIMVFWVYSAEKLNIWLFAIIGWGCPWFFVIIWAIAKYNKQNKDCWITLHGSSDALDFIIYAPNLTVIGVNLVFLFSIIWVLVSKINSSQNFDGGQYT